MFDWLRRRLSARQPSVAHQVIGELRCRSTVLLISDPSGLYDAVRVEGVPTGNHTLFASLVRYPEGGERVARIAIRFRPGTTDGRRPLGTFGVDAGTAVALDEGTFQAHWAEVGPERIGRTATPHHRRVAQLIGDKFGLRWREVHELRSRFTEPISEELETQITEFLRTFPEFAPFPFMYFRIQTGNTLDRVFEAMRARLWHQLTLDEVTGAHLFAVSAGFGDGRYEVVGLYEAGQLRAVEVEFIGPDQDATLAAFPLLRY